MSTGWAQETLGGGDWPSSLPFLRIGSQKENSLAVWGSTWVRRFSLLIAGDLSGACFGFGISFVETEVTSSLSWQTFMLIPHWGTLMFITVVKKFGWVLNRLPESRTSPGMEVAIFTGIISSLDVIKYLSNCIFKQYCNRLAKDFNSKDSVLGTSTVDPVPKRRILRKGMGNSL